LRKCTYGGRPFGAEDFVDEMERRFLRKWPRRSKNPAELGKPGQTDHFLIYSVIALFRSRTPRPHLAGV
jgi:hypothetical protein